MRRAVFALALIATPAIAQVTADAPNPLAGNAEASAAGPALFVTMTCARGHAHRPPAGVGPGRTRGEFGCGPGLDSYLPSTLSRGCPRTQHRSITSRRRNHQPWRSKADRRAAVIREPNDTASPHRHLTAGEVQRRGTRARCGGRSRGAFRKGCGCRCGRGSLRRWTLIRSERTRRGPAGHQREGHEEQGG